MKKCFKCLKIKDLSKFYVHKQMGDGHLNKCISCAKKDVNERYSNPLFIEKIKEYERKRFKDPERKKRVKEYLKAMRLRNPVKFRSRNKIGNSIRDGKIVRKPCEVCGDKKSQAHHVDYRSPLKVKWLCFKHHRELHGQIVN